MTQDRKVTANRTYKSSVFTMVFQEKKELLELYNAVSGKHYEDPQFVIFYNGEQEVPEREIMQLSSLYTVKEEWPKLELEAAMLNIRPGHNQRLMEASTAFRK